MFFTRSVRRPNGRDAPGRNASAVPGIYRDREPIYLRATPDVEYVDSLEPEPDEYEVTKLRYDAFESSNLERCLRTEAVGTVLLCGCMTGSCAGATARSAYERGFGIVLADDCAASITGLAHRAAVENVDMLLSAAAESDGIRLPGNEPGADTRVEAGPAGGGPRGNVPGRGPPNLGAGAGGAAT